MHRYMHFQASSSCADPFLTLVQLPGHLIALTQQNRPVDGVLGSHFCNKLMIFDVFEGSCWVSGRSDLVGAMWGHANGRPSKQKSAFFTIIVLKKWTLQKGAFMYKYMYLLYLCCIHTHMYAYIHVCICIHVYICISILYMYGYMCTYMAASH